MRFLATIALLVSTASFAATEDHLPRIEVPQNGNARPTNKGIAAAIPEASWTAQQYAERIRKIFELGEDQTPVSIALGERIIDIRNGKNVAEAVKDIVDKLKEKGVFGKFYPDGKLDQQAQGQLDAIARFLAADLGIVTSCYTNEGLVDFPENLELPFNPDCRVDGKFPLEPKINAEDLRKNNDRLEQFAAEFRKAFQPDTVAPQFSTDGRTDIPESPLDEDVIAANKAGQPGAGLPGAGDGDKEPGGGGAGSGGGGSGGAGSGQQSGSGQGGSPPGGGAQYQSKLSQFQTKAQPLNPAPQPQGEFKLPEGGQDVPMDGMAEKTAFRGMTAEQIQQMRDEFNSYINEAATGGAASLGARFAQVFKGIMSTIGRPTQTGTGVSARGVASNSGFQQRLQQGATGSTASRTSRPAGTLSASTASRTTIEESLANSAVGTRYRAAVARAREPQNLSAGTNSARTIKR